MSSRFSTTQIQQQKMNLSAAQIQSLQMLTLQSLQIEQRIEHEVEENPALEKIKDDEEEKDTTLDEYLKDEERSGTVRQTVSGTQNADRQALLMSRLTADSSTLADTLKEQLAYLPLTEKEKPIADFIIGTLDGDGYLRKYNRNISDDLIFTQNIDADPDEIETVIRKIQTLDPAGVAARDLKECLLLQLKRDSHPDAPVLNAILILEQHYDAFVNRRYDAIIAKTGMTRGELKEAAEEITSLNPKPANGFSDEGIDQTQSIMPDFFVEYDKQADEFSVAIAGEDSAGLRVSKSYLDMARSLRNGKDEESKQAVEFITAKIKAAEWFIASIRQRYDTLRKTMNAIIGHQRKFFTDGDRDSLRPMILKDIAEATGLDISTVWRVVDSKYVQTGFGIFSLKDLFSGGYTTSDGTEVTAGNIKNILKSHIGDEDPSSPLTDQQLAGILKENGYDIARRTIAKYREQLGIPVARLRKKI